MAEDKPVMVSNAEFTGYEEEDIDGVTGIEDRKLEASAVLPGLKAEIEAELGPGRWEKHWVTVDDRGTRVFAAVYLAEGRTAAVTAAGDLVRDFTY